MLSLSPRCPADLSETPGAAGGGGGGAVLGGGGGGGGAGHGGQGAREGRQARRAGPEGLQEGCTRLQAQVTSRHSGFPEFFPDHLLVTFYKTLKAGGLKCWRLCR